MQSDRTLRGVRSLWIRVCVCLAEVVVWITDVERMLKVIQTVSRDVLLVVDEAVAVVVELLEEVLLSGGGKSSGRLMDSQG